MSMHLRINRKPYRESSLRQYVSLARAVSILTALGILLLFSSHAYAQLFHIYFEKDGKPYDKPVTGEIKFHAPVPLGNSESKELFSCLVDCPGLNWCPIYQWVHPPYRTACELVTAWIQADEMRSIHTVYFEGETEGQEFVTSSPFDYSSDCFPDPSAERFRRPRDRVLEGEFPGWWDHCEVTFNIPTSYGSVDDGGGGG